MLRDLAATPIVPERRAGLQGPGLLQQRFLGMQLHRPSALASHALRSQRTGRADAGGELKVPAARAVVTNGGADVASGTDTAGDLDVDLKGGLRVAALVRHSRHAGHERSAGVGELLPRRASSVGAITNRLLDRAAAVGFSL